MDRSPFFITWAVIGFVILNMYGPLIMPAQAAAMPLDLNVREAIFYATQNSPAVREVKTERIKKEIEKRQAGEAIKLIRKKEKYPWFSLLMSVNLPQKHGLPKEIQLIMKIPEIQTELQKLKEQEKYEILKTKYETQVAYLDILLAKYSVERKENMQKELSQDLQRIKLQYLLGAGDKKDVEYLENQIKNNEKALQKAVLDLEKKIEVLSNLIKIKLPLNCKFSDYLPSVDLTREKLPEIIEYSVQNDYNLFTLTKEREIAQTRVVELINIYENRWGSRVKGMTNYIKNKLGRNAENLDIQLDYEDFIKNYYQPALDNIEEPWDGNFVIKLLFFKIKIPKEWFKLGYLGDRYFEDEKYAMFVALVDREKAIKKEEQAKEDLILSIKNTYGILKQMELSFEQTKLNLAAKEKEYSLALADNKLGMITFKDLHSQKMNYYQQQDSFYEMQIDYGKTIEMFNMYTSGYLDALQGDFQANNLASGDSFNQENSQSPQWYLRNTLADYKFTFGVKIPESYGITHFELYTSTHRQIGLKTPVDRTISHLPLTYENNAMLYVKLYKEEDLAYTAQLDGSDLGGPLNLEGVQAVNSSTAKVVGTWQLNKSLELFKVQLKINLTENMGGDKYGLYYLGNEEQLVGNKLYGLQEPLNHLSTTFTDLGKLKIKVFKDNAPLTELFLVRQGENTGVLIAK